MENNKLRKLGALLDKCYYTGKIPKCCTPADIGVLQCVYNDLTANERPEFISANIKTVLENIGFMTAPHGIGWIVIC